MSDGTGELPRYDRTTIVLHWTTVLLVAALWALGQTIDVFPRGSARVAARSVHILLGLLLGIVLVARFGWRAGGGVQLAPAGSGDLGDKLALLTHRVLYALLVLAVLFGIANTWVRGDTLFGVFTIPSVAPGNRSLRGAVEELHELSANVLLAIALFHAGAALVHHFVLKDAVLRRMLPRR
jgi:cytochrome b561